MKEVHFTLQYLNMFNMSKKISSILLVDDDTVIDYLHKKLLLKARIVAAITTLYNGR